jgi:bifunctional DNA-binding transcriptional regulator/antitoxin component of YhaV-PrlF toxin-antitoxin module
VVLSAQAAAVVAASDLSTSEKIRRLKQLGLRQADIARALGIRDQFVSNVVRRMRKDDTRSNGGSAAETPTEARLSTARQVRTQVGEGGRVVLPAAFRVALGIEVGDPVFLRLEDNELRVFTPRAAVCRAQELVSRFVPDEVSLVDELIAERRAEAARE